MIDISAPKLTSDLITNILTENFEKIIMDFDLNGMSNDDIKRLFSNGSLKEILISFVVKYSFDEDVTLKPSLNEPQFKRLISNLEGLYKNDYISKNDYSHIMDEIIDEISKNECCK